MAHGPSGGTITMSFISYGLLIGLAIALAIAAFTDVRSRKIANTVNGLIALGAPFYWWSSGLAVWPDMAWQLGFALAATAVLIGIYALGMALRILILGGGDIKLLAALSLWFTPFHYMQMLLVMSLFGGALAVGFVVRRVVLKPKTPGRLPYGVAIAFGSLWVLAINYLPTSAFVIAAA